MVRGKFRLHMECVNWYFTTTNDANALFCSLVQILIHSVYALDLIIFMLLLLVVLPCVTCK